VSNRTWDDVVASFGATRILTSTAMAEKSVRSQTQAALRNQIALSKATLIRNILAVRRITSGNKIVSALQTNFYLGYPPEHLGPWKSPKMSPRIFNNCSCLNIEGCPRPATINDSYGHIVTVPGMMMDCLIVDATLASTLECYYNQTCLSLLHGLLSINMQPLWNSSNKYFSINSTVQTLLNEIMIDETISDIRFDSYYSQCNPAFCSYSYTHRFDILFIFTTIIGIAGVLSLTIRIIAPLIAEAILRSKNRVLPIENEPHAISPQQNRRKLELIFTDFFKINVIPEDKQSNGMMIPKLVKYDKSHLEVFLYFFTPIDGLPNV
jgi:hypothetical protein